MESPYTFYEQPQQKEQQEDSFAQEGARAKYNLVLKTPTLCVKLKNSYIEVSDGVLSQIYGILNIKALYLHKDIELSIGHCYAISKYIKIYFIDANGNILAKYKRSKIV